MALNKQDVFNKVAKHLLTQRTKSYKSNHSECAYRNSYGLMCAIGCLIADEYYNPSLEGKRVFHLPVVNALIQSGYDVDYIKSNKYSSTGIVIASGEDIDFLMRLQLIHDNFFVEYWRNQLSIVAEAYKLEMSCQ